jgi:hypothetical protein
VDRGPSPAITMNPADASIVSPVGIIRYQNALESLRVGHAKPFRLRAGTRLAPLWRDQRRHAAARASLAPVYGRFTEGSAGTVASPGGQRFRFTPPTAARFP